jgi:serine protease AprX
VKLRAAFLFAGIVASFGAQLALCQPLATSRSTGEQKYWIFFRDKPESESLLSSHDLNAEEEHLIQRGVLSRGAIERREKVLPPSRVISASDFPVSDAYLDSIRATGMTVVGGSRWFNAAVALADSTSLAKAEKFPFVVGIKRIVAYTDRIKLNKPVVNARPWLAKSSAISQPGDSAFYGPSITQLALSGVPQVQSLGINGKGVIIGMLDDGFRYESHEALKNVRILGEHDFIQNDSITANQPGDSSTQDNHGTSTLSVIGGYSPGNLVGVSYGSSFLLAKTEYVPVTDFKWEEDNWVEGIEWMEARGVDVVSSSVAYNIFVDSSGAVDSAESYFFWRGDFNGKKSIASLAATRAAELGVVVVQAIGNEGNGDGVSGTMDVPADADSILSVGAVDLTGRLAGFSSTGPTNDGRTKPDLVADGVGDYVATVPGPDTYDYESGTSFSTPMVAGIASLILSVRPDYTPMQVIGLLKSTAVQYHDAADSNTFSYPNNFYGWGRVNAWNAIRGIGFVGSNDFAAWQRDSSIYVAVKAFSVSGINVGLSRAYYSSDGTNYSAAPVFVTDTTNQFAFRVPALTSPSSGISFYFDMVDSAARQLSIPYYGKSDPFKLYGWQLTPVISSGNLHLYEGYPNPFTTIVHIAFILKNQSYVDAEVFDVLGRKVKLIFSGNLPGGYMEFSWNGSTAGGARASSGVYFIRITANGSSKVLKVLYLR